MAPKAASAAKRALCLSYIHRSGTAHTLKDLEKALPGVASMSSMLVKDTVQAMVDENEIFVEKIGSGNWYWSFAAAEGERKVAMLEKAKEELQKVRDEVEECEKAMAEKLEENACGDDDEEEQRKECDHEREMLQVQVTAMVEELKRYADEDPVEMQRKVIAVEGLKKEVMSYTDQIESMEGWMKKNMGMDRETFRNMQKNWFGDEYDEEEQSLRQLF